MKEKTECESKSARHIKQIATASATTQERNRCKSKHGFHRNNERNENSC